MHRFAHRLIIVLALAACATLQQSQAVTIDTVPIGNPGNPAGADGYGTVDYVYRIGKYEVTAGQYTEFLNAVAKDDPYGLYNPYMNLNEFGTAGANIQRIGSAPNYSYSVAADWAD